MRTVGVIAEYNPFHNGHGYHLNEAKRVTGAARAVAVMSGNYTQRGEPAVCDKWARARFALAHGADLVIELPLCYVTGGADYFARGAAALLDKTGIVDCLCFGGESPGIDAMKAAAGVLAYEPPEYKAVLKEGLKKGLGFAAASAAALERLVSMPEGMLSRPNNRLGVEYCKALLSINSRIQPYVIQRSGGAGFMSAREIRGAVENGRLCETRDYMPGDVYGFLTELAENGGAAFLERLGILFQYRLRTCGAESLGAFSGMSAELARRFLRFSEKGGGMRGLLSAVKTRAYAYTRLQRAALNAVLGVTRAALERFEALGGPQYIRVLGFKRDSAELISAIAEKAAPPVITHVKKALNTLPPPAADMLRMEIESTDIYALAADRVSRGAGYEYKMPPVII